MRALIDYRPALKSRTGAGEYIHELARALGRLTSPWTIDLFTSSWKDRPAPTLIREVSTAHVIDRCIPNKLINLFWHRLEWPPIETLTRSSFDVVHAAHPLLIPTRAAAQIVTIHDLDFLHHPERTRAEIRRDYPALAADHAARADRIITSSQYSAGEIARHLKVPAEKISVCRAGAPEWMERQDQEHVKLPAERYILFLGTLEPRKNIGGLLDAYGLLLERDPAAPPLVIAGAKTAAAEPWIDRAQRAPLRGHVQFPGYVRDDARRSLYEGAALFVLPSHHEGFGLTALEAMSLGIPLVAADRGSLPEVVGDAGLLVDPDDPAAMAAAMARMLDDRGFADACRARGRTRALTFSWRAAAEELLRAYELALAHRRRRA